MMNDYQIRIRDLSPEKRSLLAHQLSTEVGNAITENPMEKQLIAYIVARDEHTLCGNDLRDFLKKKIPAYMLPSTFKFHEKLPRLPNGKVNRRELNGLNEVIEEEEEEETATPPHSPVEKVLSAIWSQIFNRNIIGMHDIFFEIGGHSLLVIQMISRIRNTLQVDVPFISVFNTPTIAQLSQAILMDENKRDRIETTARLLVEIAKLPEDEVNARLREKDSLLNTKE